MVEQRRPINWRQVAIFASGLLLGGVLAAWAVLELRAPATPAVPIAGKSVAPAPAAPAAKPAVAMAVAPVGPHAACPAGPAIAAAGAGDGQLRAPAETAGKIDIAALILRGKEAAASGRLRDAEVSFLSACRAADRIERADAEPADARYQLGRHYATVLLTGSAAANANRAELLKRAELLYADSLQAYRARHGEDHEKTRFAAEGLATLRQSSAQAAPARPAAAPPPRPVIATAPPPPPAAPPRQARVEAPTTPERQATAARSRGRPSFDCARARSPSERAICSDAELAQLDRDLGRLHARARDSAGDSVAFRRQNDREWRRREATCRGDRECLRRWYDRRRDQLLEAMEDDGR